MFDPYRLPNGMVRSEKRLLSCHERSTPKLFSEWLEQNDVVRCNQVPDLTSSVAEGKTAPKTECV